jgi:hypothetical protein
LKECWKGDPTNVACSFGGASQSGLNFRKVVEVWPFELCDVCILFAATGTAQPHVDYLCSPRKHGSKSSRGSVIVAAKTPPTEDNLVAPHGG